MPETVEVEGEPWVLPTWAAQVDDRVSTCRSCFVRIVWCETLHGKRAPLNPDGTHHFSTCPDRDVWRRPR